MIIKQGKHTILTGRVAKDPEKKVINSKNGDALQLIEMGVVVDKIDDKSIWANVYSWGTLLEKVKVRDLVFVTGFEEKSSYIGRDGAEHESVKIRVEYIDVMNKSEKTSTSNDAPPELQEIENDDGLPF